MKNFKERFKTIKEMFGRTKQASILFNSILSSQVPKLDSSRSDYNLMKALFYASDYNGEGADYILGAGFAKPIVNATAAFILPTPLRISCDDKKTEEGVNTWLYENHNKIQKAIKNSLRDGDSYLRYENNILTLLPAEQIRKKINIFLQDKDSNGTWGFDYIVAVGDGIDEEKYITLYRRTAPFKKVLKIKGSQTKGEILDIDGTRVEGQTEEYQESNDIMAEEVGDVNSLPIIHFPNEKEPEMVYGISEYQNCLGIFREYHRVMDNAIKNNIYNSTSMPYITGIKNSSKFLERNFDMQPDGTYKVQWNPENILLLDDGMKVEFADAPKTTQDAEKLLNLLFWNICQTSETPEFVMGTAVSSSKASVSEQMPVMVRKAVRKQEEFKHYFKQLIDKYLEENEKEIDYKLIMPPIFEEKDRKLNKDIVELLFEAGCITKKTGAMMLDIDKHVDNLDEEIEKAQEESLKDLKDADIYKPE